MEANVKLLLKLLGERDINFKIPVYQRNYDWSEKNCTDYLNSLDKIILSNLESYFIGSIVYIKSNYMKSIDLEEEEEFVIIDGQQRITTTHLFLKALYDLYEDIKIKNSIKESYLFNKYDEQEKLKLKPIKEDEKVFSKLIIDDIKDESSNSNILKNYNFFYRALEAKLKHDSSALNKFYNALKRTYIVEIILQRNLDDPQAIFESINSTGLDLTQADLIRNYILMDKEYEQQTMFFENYWYEIERLLINSTNISKFIKDYLTMSSGNISKDKNIYIDFKAYYENKNIDDETILKELLYYAKLYKSYILDSEIVGNTEISINLNLFHVLKNKVVYPFLLMIVNLLEKKYISENDFKKIVNLTVNYLIRRYICGYKSNFLNSCFSNLIKAIINLDYNKNIYDSIEKFLLEKDFPENSLFKYHMAHNNIYRDNKQLAKSMLYLIEKENNESCPNIDDLSLILIAPNKLSNNWKFDLSNNDTNNWEERYNIYLNTFGNLTLIESSKENELNKSETFNNKKQLLINSSLFLNKYFNDESINVWKKDSVEDRAKRLFELIESQYNHPKTSNKVKKQFKKLYERDVLSNNIKLSKGDQLIKYYFDNKEYKFTNWKNFIVKFGTFINSIKKDEFVNIVRKNEEEYNIIFSTNHRDFQNPLRVCENVYIDDNKVYGLSLIMIVVRLICEKLNIDKKRIKFNYKVFD